MVYGRDRQAVFFVTLIILIIIAAGLVLSGCSITGNAVFEDTLKKIDEIDSRHGISIQDYSSGVSHFRYNPRFPDPLNAGEVDSVVQEFRALESGLENGSASMLLVKAREDLLLSEKFYKLGTKTKKGLTSSGFRCSNEVFIRAATHNLKMSVGHGREAVENLDIITREYPEKAERINISMFWVKQLNMTYGFLEDDAIKNQRTFDRICGND